MRRSSSASSTPEGSHDAHAEVGIVGHSAPSRADPPRAARGPRRVVLDAPKVAERAVANPPAHLVAGTSSEPGPGTETPKTPSSAACPPGLKGVGFNFKFTEIVTFELQVECEKVTIQASGDLVPGLIGAFGKVTYSPRSGTMSVFAGAKGGLSADIPVVVFEGVKGEAAWRSGVYVTIDRQGGLVDVGFRTGPGVSGRLGGDVGVKASTSDEIDFSVAGVFGAGLGI